MKNNFGNNLPIVNLYKNKSLKSGIDTQLLYGDSFKVLKKCLKLCKNKYETEYSGNANLNNIYKISKTGVNRVSVGSLTHSAKSFDSSLII